MNYVNILWAKFPGYRLCQCAQTELGHGQVHKTSTTFKGRSCASVYDGAAIGIL